MKITRGDRVLEVGSGAKPHKKSTVLCDKFLHDDSQRGGQKIFLGKLFVLADGEHLPFKNKSFDYSICAHILEHVENPINLAKELERVSKRGYIETPSIVWEKMQPFRKHHKWLIFETEHSLVLTRNTLYDPIFADLISHIIYGSKSIAILRKSMKNVLNVHFEWENRLEIQIDPPNYQHLLHAWLEKKIHTIENNLASELGYNQDKAYWEFLHNTLKFRRLDKIIRDIISIPIRRIYRRSKNSP